MIRVVVKHESNTLSNGSSERENIIGFFCEGHSGYGKGGPDIVCAAVSVIMDTIERGIRDLPMCRPTEITIKIDSIRNSVSYDCENSISLGPLYSLFEAARLSFMSIAAEYPDDVSFEDTYVSQT
ncbi:MAG: ribosomal-processing cysteine protease Prp [Synergistaceae bacterium]